ncbi:MAG: hypothetical protein HQL42_14105 [Alphaproteobacteria bacterium]|nr:hypothetical protein [Alphaproteobacteria bacterium]
MSIRPSLQIRLAASTALCLLSSGCSYLDYFAAVNEKGFREFSKSRNQKVVLRETVTRYTGALRCVGDLVVARNQALHPEKPFQPDTIAVGALDDKSGRLNGTASPLPQSMREMATRAFAEVQNIRVAEAIDLSAARLLGENVAFGSFRRDPASGRWVLAETTATVPDKQDSAGKTLTTKKISVKEITHIDASRQPQLLNSMLSNNPRPGQFVRSDFYLSGAITEYSDQKIGLSSGVNIIDFGVSYTQRNVDISIDLRLVNSTTGEVIRVQNRNDISTPYTTVSLRNTVRSVELNGNYFRVSDNSVTSANSTGSLSDPVHFAVREAIEGAIAVLVGKFYEVDYQSCLREDVDPKTGDGPWKKLEDEDESRAKIDEAQGVKRTILFAPNGLPGRSLQSAPVAAAPSVVDHRPLPGPDPAVESMVDRVKQEMKKH